MQKNPLNQRDEILVKEYLRVNANIYKLAYTRKFDLIYKNAKRQGDTRTKAQLFERIIELFKEGYIKL